MDLYPKYQYKLHNHTIQSKFITKLDRLFTHPLWGLLILFGFLGVTLWLTYQLALPASEWLHKQLVGNLGELITKILQGTPPWLVGLLVKGVLSGVGTVISFIPILFIFFTVLVLMEESGYLSRAAQVTDRYLRRLGLPGKACVPLSMGFGCNTPAVLGCRIITERRSRLLTMMLVPLIPCTSRMAVIAFLTPVFFGKYAVLVSWGLVVFNLTILVLTGIMVNWISPSRREKNPAFPLPDYMLPNLQSVIRKVFINLREFLSKMKLLIVFSIIIWILSSFSLGRPDQSLLAQIGKSLIPLGSWMGIKDWRLIVALLASFITKENTLAVLGILFSTTSSGLSLNQQVAAVLPGAAGLAYLVVQMLFVPCIATVVSIKQVSGSWKYAMLAINFSLLLSLLVGTIIFWLANLFNWQVI